jgi:hypothetical protein
MMIDGFWFALAICALAMTVNVGLHLAVHRITSGYMRAVFAGFAGGLLLFAIGQIVRFALCPEPWLEIAVLVAGDLAIFGCLSFLFFNFVNAGESAIRVRILRELREMPGPVREADLLAVYNDQIILEARLGRMMRNGQLGCEDERYRLLSPMLAWMAEFFRVLKRLLLRRSSEFDVG